MAKGDGTFLEGSKIVWDEKEGDYVAIPPTFIECVIPIIVILGLIIAVIIWAKTTDRTFESPVDKQWNNGICVACETPWHYIDSVGTVNSARYIYECECGNHRMESYTLR